MRLLTLRQLRGVDTQHVGAEQRQCAGGDRPGDDPGQIEHPQPGGRPHRVSGERRQHPGRDGGAERPEGRQRSGGRGDALGVGGPGVGGTGGDGEPTRGVDGFLDLRGAAAGQCGLALGFPAGEARHRGLLAYTVYLGHTQLGHAVPQSLPAEVARGRYLDGVIDTLVRPRYGGDEAEHVAI